MSELVFLEQMPTLTEPIVEVDLIHELENATAIQIETAGEIVETPPGTEIVTGGVAAIRTLYNLEYGIDLPPELLQEALLELELWNPENGMSLTSVQCFLELIGTESVLSGDTTVTEIETELAQGNYVLISGDIGELIGLDAPDEDDALGESADYMFMVRSIDYNDSGETTATLYALNGTDNQGITVPLQVFENARADGGADVLIIGTDI